LESSESNLRETIGPVHRSFALPLSLLFIRHVKNPCGYNIRGSKYGTASTSTIIVSTGNLLSESSCAFRDIKVDLRTFAVQANDPSGSPVTILINPDTFMSSTELENQKASAPQNSETGEKANPTQNVYEKETTGSLGSSTQLRKGRHGRV
jgi:hypothetical protein